MNQLLLASQVILSMLLSFAVIPLIQFTSDTQKMGVFVNSRLMKIAALEHCYHHRSIKWMVIDYDRQVVV